MSGPEDRQALEMPLDLSGILTRIGMGRLGRLGLEPAERYQRERPGELIHIDVKKLGRIQGGAGKRVRDGLRQHYNRNVTDRDGKRRNTVGWDSCTLRSTTPRAWPTPKCSATRRERPGVAFLGRALVFFARYGITVERVIT